MRQFKPISVDRRRKLLYLCALMMDMCVGIILFAVPLFLIQRLHATVFTVGLAGSLGGLGYTISCLGTGRLSDRVGRKKVVATGIAVFICAYMIMSQVRDVYSVFVLIILGGVGFSMFWPPVQAWVAQSTPRESLRTTLGIFNVAWSSGLMAGPLIGGLLFPIGYRIPFYFACGLGVILFFIVLRLSEEGKQKEQALDGPEISTVEHATEKTTFLFIAWIANFVIWFIAAMTRNVFPVLALSLKIDPRTLGFLFCLVGLSQTCMFVLLGRVKGWHYRLELLLFSQALAPAGLIIAFLTSATPLFALSFILIGISGGMSYFSSLFYSLDSPSVRGRKTGFHESILGTGLLLGPLCGGLVARYYDLRAPYLLGSALVVCAIVLEVVIYRNSMKRKRLHG